MKKKKIVKTYYNASFYKEIAMSILAVTSVILLIFEIFSNPTPETIRLISRFDIWVALIFLADFFVAMLAAKSKLNYVSKNWYLLLASIPIVDSWAEILRLLRIFELVRIFRAGTHLTYVYEKAKSK